MSQVSFIIPTYNCVHFLENEEHGLLVSVGAPQELGQAVVRFFQNAALRESCAENALQKVIKEFNYDKLIKGTLAVYEEAIVHYRASVRKENHYAQS
jgi:glycosyltransferase involved in cell wall biosynthesis